MPFFRQQGSGTAAPGSIDVTDGGTTVSPAVEISFTSGATVTDLGGGVAGVAINFPAVNVGLVQIAAGVPVGPPAGVLPIAFDSTAVTGGLYVWDGAAWVKVSVIP